MLEIELSVFTPSIADGGGVGSHSSSDSSSSSSKVDNALVIDSNGEPVVFHTLFVPVICCAEHSVPPLTVMAQIASV